MLQKTYGKVTAEDLPALANLLINDLKGYDPAKIIQAVAECRKNDEEFITLAAIRKIIDPKPVYEKTVYLALKDKNKHTWLTSDEWKYIEGYEASKLKGY